MKFNKRTDEELIQLLPQGRYICEIQSAIEKISKTTHKPMLHLTVRAYRDHDYFVDIAKYIMHDADKSIKDFCYSFGLEHEYDSEQLIDRSCVGRWGKANVVVEPAQGEYLPKNAINYFIRGAWTRNEIGQDNPLQNLSLPFNEAPSYLKESTTAQSRNTALGHAPANVSEINPPFDPNGDIPW